MSFDSKNNTISWKRSRYPNPIPGVTDSITKLDGAYPASILSATLRIHGGNHSLGFNAYYEADCLNYALGAASSPIRIMRRIHNRAVAEKKFGKIDWKS